MDYCEFCGADLESAHNDIPYGLTYYTETVYYCTGACTGQYTTCPECQGDKVWLNAVEYECDCGVTSTLKGSMACA